MTTRRKTGDGGQGQGSLRRSSVSTMQSVERTCNVLLSFRADDPVLGVSEIARRLSLPKSAVHRTLHSLVQIGLVMRDRATSRYRLGPRATELGFAALATPDIRGMALPVLQNLSRHSEETATLSLLIGYQRFYAAQVAGPQDVKMSVEIGRHYPLYAGASGRAILAYFAPAQLQVYLSSTPLDRLTNKTIIQSGQLLAELERVRALGYAVSYGERDAWAGAVAAPLFIGGHVVGCISVCGPHNRFTPEKVKQYGELLRRETSHLSKHLDSQGGVVPTAMPEARRKLAK